MAPWPSFTISAWYRAWCGPRRSASPPTRFSGSSLTIRCPRAKLSTRSPDQAGPILHSVFGLTFPLFLQPRHDLDEGAGPMAVVELRLEDTVPSVLASPGRARHAENLGAPGET